MRYLCICMLLLCFVQCETNKEKKGGFRYQRREQKGQKKEQKVVVPVDLNNKGIGPVTSVNFTTDIDEKLANQGKALFMEKCTVCHLPNKRMVGPAMQGVYDKRSAEWVMNMIMNPIEMLKKDPVAKALQKEYSGAVMTDQRITEKEARAIAEYLRTL